MSDLYYGRALIVVWDDDFFVGLVAGPTEVSHEDAKKLIDAAYASVSQAYPGHWDFTDLFDRLEELGFSRVDHEEWSQPK